MYLGIDETSSRDSAVRLQDLHKLLSRFHVATHIATVASEPHTWNKRARVIEKLFRETQLHAHVHVLAAVRDLNQNTWCQALNVQMFLGYVHVHVHVHGTFSFCQHVLYMYIISLIKSCRNEDTAALW